MKKEKEEEPPRRPRRRHRFLPLAIGTSGGVMLAGLAFWFFEHQAEAVAEGKSDQLDTAIMKAVHTIDNAVMHDVMEAVTQLGSHVSIAGAAGFTALAMIRQGRRHDAWTIAVSTGGAMALNTFLKNVFRRQRPKELARQIRLPKSHSFPSGHSLLAAATYPIIVHHLVEDHSVPVQALAHTLTGLILLGVGFSRVYFGVHFPSDVLGGYAAGFGWLGLTSLSHTIVERSEGKLG